MQTFCTIITADYLPMAKVLHASLQKYNKEISLQVLVVNDNNYTSTSDFFIHKLEALYSSPFFKEIENKYAHTNKDYFRWALKPLFIVYLLENGFSKIMFTDPDIYFVNDYAFLFKELDENNILLTPHWASLNPTREEDSLLAVLKGGLFNAGFVGANRNGLSAIKCWAELCHYKTEDQKSIGLFVDQKYLDLLQVQFENVFIIRHKGCNLASWNIETCKRTFINNRLLINQSYEPVFIHFTMDTIENIKNGNDILLQPYLEEYLNSLEANGFNISNLSKINKSFFHLIKSKTLIRTRLKRFLFKLAENL